MLLFNYPHLASLEAPYIDSIFSSGNVAATEQTMVEVGHVDSGQFKNCTTCVVGCWQAGRSFEIIYRIYDRVSQRCVGDYVKT